MQASDLEEVEINESCGKHCETLFWTRVKSCEYSVIVQQYLLFFVFSHEEILHFWIKIIFIFFCFAEGMIAGLIPTCSEGCRTNPKILGIANSFAAGVFMAIALMHVLPEMIERWTEIVSPARVFPLPELMAFIGYTLILSLDKVLFDTHVLFDREEGHDGHAHRSDPAELKFEKNVRETYEQILKADLTPNTSHLKRK